MAIRTAILGEVRLFRDGLASLLRGSPAVDVVATAATLAEALQVIERDQPEALLLDMAMPNALEQIQALAGASRDLKIVALGVPETATDVMPCAEAGAAGYVPRDASVDDLIGALQAAARGELRCSVRIAAALLRRVAELARTRTGMHPGTRATLPTALTARELDVLRLLEAGRTNKDIARELGIELATAKNHVHNVLEKLGVRGRAQAIAVASRWLPRAPSGLGVPVGG